MANLTDSLVKRLPPPARSNRITYDTAVKGFGCRVTAAGARAFILNYRTNAGHERRYTIGAFPAWSTTAARKEAAHLKLEVRVNGADPVGGLQAARGEPTVADMVERYIEEHLPKKRPASQAEDLGLIKQWISSLRHLRVAAVTIEDVDNLHRKDTRAGTPYRANRVLALLSKMFALASKRWRWRADNPCQGVERNQEAKRARYLTAAEIERLTWVLTAYPDQQAANIVRLLLFTGARRGEVLAAKWEDFDIEAGTWTKPGAHHQAENTSIACRCRRQPGPSSRASLDPRIMCSLGPAVRLVAST